MTLHLLKDSQDIYDEPSSFVRTFLLSDYCRSLSENTVELYSNALVKNFLPFCVSHNIIMTPAIVQASMPAYASYLERKALSGATIQQYINILRIMMKAMGTPIIYAYRRSSEDRRAQKIKQMKRWFDEADIAKCLAYDKPCIRDQLIIRLLAETGARVQELSMVTWQDIDLDANTIWLRYSKTQPRSNFFSDETKLLFYKLKGHSLFDSFDNRPLFPSVNRVKEIVADILIELGLKTAKDGRGSHTFRHWVATYLYYVGNMQLTEIASLLGDRAQTINNTYLHPTAAMMKKRVVKAMGWE